MALISELIDFRTFSSMWFWILLALIWMRVLSYVLGVPLDMIQQAQQGDDEAQSNMVDLARIRITRLLDMVATLSWPHVGVASFFAAALVLLAVGYHSQFAQAVLLIVVPMGGVVWLDWRASNAIVAENPEPARLIELLRHHRGHVQLVAYAAFALTAIWGMWSNLRLPGWY